jgi:hypothetical protein
MPLNDINTFADCKYRRERIFTTEEVLAGIDWQRGLCSDRCPQSHRNSDYSRCLHPSVDGKSYKHCSIYYERFEHNEGETINATWCETNTLHKNCPMGFPR